MSDLENNRVAGQSDTFLLHHDDHAYIKSNFADQDELEHHFDTQLRTPLTPPPGTSNIQPNIHIQTPSESHQQSHPEHQSAQQQQQRQGEAYHEYHNEKPHDSQGPLDRWPTLFEILNRKTKPPVDLWSFYIYMRDTQKSIDYLDFWIDTVQHMNLCKAYVKGLSQSLTSEERIRNAGRVTKVAEDRLRNSGSEVLDSTADLTRPPVPGNRYSNTDSNNSRDSKVRSITSSMLLNLLSANNLLQDNNPHRLSEFLRGETELSPNDPDVQQKLEELRRLSANRSSYLTTDDDGSSFLQDFNLRSFANQRENDESKRLSTIRPEMVEQLIENETNQGKDFNKNHFVTRIMLRKSSQHILKTYFMDHAEKRIVVPKDMIQRVLFSLEEEGRDDPEVFDETREYVFKAMEHEAYPNFLRYNAMSNVCSTSSIIRLFIAFLTAFIGFWVGYTLIFLNYKPKPTRAVVLIPFFIASYSFWTSYYRIDPLLIMLGYGESIASYGGLVKIEEKFVRDLLKKKAIFTFFIICLVAACLTVLFALVPGYRLHH